MKYFWAIPAVLYSYCDISLHINFHFWWKSFQVKMTEQGWLQIRLKHHLPYNCLCKLEPVMNSIGTTMKSQPKINSHRAVEAFHAFWYIREQSCQIQWSCLFHWELCHRLYWIQQFIWVTCYLATILLLSWLISSAMSLSGDEEMEGYA